MFFPCPLQECSRIPYKKDRRGVYPFNEISVCFRIIFSFVWDTLKIIFSFIFNSPGCLLSIFPSNGSFLFLRAFWFYPNLVVLFLPLFVFFYFSSFAWHVFQCQIKFQYTDCILLLLMLGSPVLFHFWQIV